jgi:thiol-disulfide isomerase/thioredoxin
MALLSAFLGGAAAINFGANVVALGRSNFAKEVDRRDNTTIWFIMFHGPHCPHCQMAYPELIAATNEASGLVRFGQVNTDEDGSFSQRFQLHGIPQFYIFHPKGHTHYQFERNARSFLNSASTHIPNLAALIDETWLNLTDKSVILFSDKKSPPPLWKGISCAFKNASIHVGFCTNHTLQQLFGVVPVPTILLVDGENRVPYAGAVKFAAIRQAVKEFIAGTYRQPPTPRPTRPPKMVHALSQQEFEGCKGKGKFCVIAALGIAEDGLERVAQRYRKDPFKFYVVTSDGPLSFLDGGIWVLHHRKELAISVDGIKDLPSALQRVIDGSVQWGTIPQVAQKLDL